MGIKLSKLALWLKNFQSRHGIRQLAIQGETISAKKDCLGSFKANSLQLIEEVMKQLYWKALLTKTLASQREEKAPGYKVN